MLSSGLSPFVEPVRALEDLDAGHSRGVVVVGTDPTAAPEECLKPKMRARNEATSAMTPTAAITR